MTRCCGNAGRPWSITTSRVGDLLSRGRTDAVSGAPLTENFSYSLLNQLTTTAMTVPGGQSVLETYDYDVLGNITVKSGQTYAYQTGCMAGSRPAGPHAVCSAGIHGSFR